jgi:2-phospho-L-lactate guanylyltransferase
MTSASVWAVVPVKPFRMAKRRLSAALSAAERTRLARVMLEDVLGAIAASRHVLAGLIVLTADDEAATIARRHDALVLVEAAPAGLNAAIERAIDHLAGTPEAGVLVIPADLPHVSPIAVEEIVGLLSARPVVALVPATGGGTNLLACKPAGVIPPGFGPNSFDRHCQAAREAGVTPTILAWSDLGRDIDRPDDLAAFLALETATRTHAFLSSLGRLNVLTP